MALRLNFRSAEHCTPRRRQIRGSVLANGMPAPRLALDRILFERGFTRLSETDDRRMGIYRVICKQLRIADRKVRRIARLVENQLHLYYNGLAREGKERHTDSANDRLRILSRIFRCSITIFGTNDMKHHRHFSSGGDVRAIMLLEVRPSRYEALQFLEEYRFIEEPQYDEMRSLDFAMQTLNLEPFYATPVMSDFQMFHTSVFQSPPSQNLAYPMLDRCPFF